MFIMKAGFYEKEITPPIGCDIPGYFNHRYSENIHDRLYARAVSIEANGNTVIMISLDAIRVPQSAYELAIAKIEKVIGISSENVLLAATHSHTAGAVSHGGEWKTPDEAYIEQVGHSAADCAIMAYRGMRDSEARFADGVVENQAFCRDYLMKDGNIRTNPSFHNPEIERVFGKSDPAFPVMFFFDTDGKPFGAITSFACHHDCKAGREISADYSGILSAEMKKALGHDFVNILFSGACGNINSWNPLSKTLRENPGFIEVGLALAEAELKLIKTAKTFPIENVSSAKGILPIKRREITKEKADEARWLLENVEFDNTKVNINDPENQMFKRVNAVSIIEMSEMPTEIDNCIQTLRIGDCTFYCLPGEIYAEYGLYMKEMSDTKHNMVVTIANKGVWGYVITPEVAGTTSYPAQLPDSPLVTEAGQMMADFALDLSKKLHKE